MNYIPKIFVALVILFLVGALANWLRGVLSDATSSFEWGNLATNVAVVGVWLIGIFAVLDQLEIAESIVQTTFTVLMGSIGGILVIRFGVGGIWAARDRFWPAVYDRISSATRDTSGSSSGSASTEA